MSGNRRLAAFAAFGILAGASTAADPPVLVLPFNFSIASTARVWADIPLPPAPGRAAALGLIFDAPVPPGPVRAVTVHLRSGNGWLGAEIPVGRAKGSVRIPLSAFSPEGSPGPATAADTLRLSLWARATEGTGTVSLASAALLPPAAVAVAGSGQWADRCARILDRIGVAHDRIGSDLSEDTLAGLRVLFLPDASSIPASDAATLRKFVRRGGRLFVFYSADQTLADAVGVRPGLWEPAQTEWTGFAVSSTGRRVPHLTGNRICPEPGPKGRAVAFWLDDNGKPGKRPAVVTGPGGAWFAHVPPRAYPAACELFSSLLADLAPGLVPPQPSKPSEPSQPSLPPSFLLAAWTTQRLAEPPPKQLGALFVGVPAGAPFPKQAGAPAPARHAWILCLATEDGSWRDPADPAVRKAVAKEAVRLVRAGAAGVHLDYVRSASGVAATPERTAAVTTLVREVSAAVRAANPDAVVSAAVFPTPAGAAAVNQDWPAWISEGLVDFVSPMIYDDDPASFAACLGACLAVAPASALLPGIGTGSDESQTDLAATSAELSAAIDAGCRGAAFYKLDDSLRELLPALPQPAR